MDSIPSSSALTVLKRSLPGALGAAAASAAYNFALGARARQSIDTSRSFSTWSSKMPSYRKRSRSRRAPRRAMPMVRYRSPLTNYVNCRRTTGLYSLTIPSGTYSNFSTSVIRLNLVKTADLIAAYDMYKIRKVQAVFVPSYDPGNSGLANNNTQQLVCSCDPASNTSLTTLADIAAYDNHKSTWMTSGRPWVYTFYPKVLNTVDNSGTATASGSYAVNPWLSLSTGGVDIPHRQLHIFTSTTLPAPAAGIPLSYYFVIHFACKNQR